MRVALVRITDHCTLISEFPDAYQDGNGVRKVDISEADFNRYWAAREAYLHELNQIELAYLRQ